ncbi:catalase [Rugamonas sp. CCM 8940]|uniref:catalase n=1 Tax=Rugamonas sp. CCM 8940 TaxID=2765359 RepID=UPI0018F75AAE|nr:catalase [Rugamonas sp. CCM 8940]MBJ7309331.1 catalase [Rugamonas sp. CCM 8940]
MSHQHEPGEALLDELLAALQATFGRHPGQRATHAKGLVASGSFTASAAAGRLSRAAHFQGQAVPVTLRLSNFSGIPQTPDSDPSASPHGLGLRFHAGAGAGAGAGSESESGGGAETDIVAHSFDGFPVATAEAFLAFLQGIAASLAEPSPDPAPLERFLAGHATARHYLAAAKPAPRSYASIAYFGVNAFRLVAADGTLSTGRYRIDPMPAQDPVPAAELAALGDDYLAEELAERLTRGPVSMRLVFQLAGVGDDSADGSLAWPHTGPDAREEVVLGELRIEALAADQAQAARGLALDPGRLIDGLMLSDDPMVPLRSAVYRLAASRRAFPPTNPPK